MFLVIYLRFLFSRLFCSNCFSCVSLLILPLIVIAVVSLPSCINSLSPFVCVQLSIVRHCCCRSHVLHAGMFVSFCFSCQLKPPVSNWFNFSPCGLFLFRFIVKISTFCSSATRFASAFWSCRQHRHPHVTIK